MARIAPFLWFEGNMKEAVEFYLSVFADSKLKSLTPASATFELLGQEFMALNAHPHEPFNDAVSFFVKCADQDEVDYYWTRLADGGREQRCGWLNDRFGVRWQVVPSALGRMLSDPDREKAARVMQAMLKMKKIVIADLEAAYHARTGG